MLRLRSRRLTEMLTEQIMLEETQDRLLIGFRPLLSKYALGQAGPLTGQRVSEGQLFLQRSSLIRY